MSIKAHLDTLARWWEANIRRCENGHVSRVVLKSEALGRDACLSCRAPVHLTFPEDEEGVDA